MVREDLFGPRGSGPRQPHDEDRPLRVASEAADALEELLRTRLNQARDEPLMLRRVVLLLSARPPVGQLLGVGVPQMLGGLLVGPLRVECKGQAVVQSRAFGLRQ